MAIAPYMPKKEIVKEAMMDAGMLYVNKMSEVANRIKFNIAKISVADLGGYSIHLKFFNFLSTEVLSSLMNTDLLAILPKTPSRYWGLFSVESFTNSKTVLSHLSFAFDISNL